MNAPKESVEASRGPVAFRAVAREDADCVYASWGQFPENFERTTARSFEGVSDARTFLESLLSAPNSMALHIIARGDVVGLVKAAVDGHRAQVGYIIHKPHWGRGLATAAVREMLSRLEMRPAIQRVWATCALDNFGSIRVLEKCGFEREGVLRNWVIFPALGTRAVDNYSYVLPAPGRPQLPVG